MRLSEAEQAFHEDVREKKKTASGVHHKTGKRGYTGKIMFPTDFMSRKEKYNHRKAGKCMTTNLFDSILTIDEFEQLEIHEQKNRMQYWRNNNQIKEIQFQMGISNKKFYDIIAALDLPKAPRGGFKGKRTGTGTAKQKSIAIEKQKELQPEAPAPAAPAEIEKPAVQELIVDGLHVVFNGTYSAEKIEKQLTKFMLLIEGEEDEFYIEVKLMQKAAQK